MEVGLGKAGCPWYPWWARTSCKWGYNPILIGVITPVITGRGPLCRLNFSFFVYYTKLAMIWSDYDYD